MKYFRVSIDYNNDTKEIVVEFVFGRELEGFIISTCVPAILANLIGHMTNYFEDDLFDLAISVNLTIMLVITTM